MSSSDWLVVLKHNNQTGDHGSVEALKPCSSHAGSPCQAVSRGARLVCCSSRGSRKLVLPAGLALGGSASSNTPFLQKQQQLTHLLA